MIAASVYVAVTAHSGDLNVRAMMHMVGCPSPGSIPCVMKRPFNVMQYTLLTKNVEITELNGVWSVTFDGSAFKKSDRPFEMHLLDFYGNAHVIEVTFDKSNIDETEVKKPQKKLKNISKSSLPLEKGKSAEQNDQTSTNLKSSSEPFINFKP